MFIAVLLGIIKMGNNLSIPTLGIDIQAAVHQHDGILLSHKRNKLLILNKGRIISHVLVPTKAKKIQQLWTKCSHEIKKHLFLGRKAMTKLHSMLKNRDITLPTKVHPVKGMFFQ